MKNIGMLVVTLIMATGCGGKAPVEGRPPVYPTTLTVLYNGNPVEGAVVTLRPKEGTTAAYGKTGTDGGVKLTSFEPGDGALAGEHEVRVRKVELDTVPDPSPGNPDGYKIVNETNLVPDKYDKFESSGLTVVVEDKKLNRLTVELVD